MTGIKVDAIDIVKPLLGLVVGFLGRLVGFWTKDSLKGLGDVIFRFTNSAMFIAAIIESTKMSIHWAMPICILLFNLITMAVGWMLFKHLKWPSNVILTMASTGLMGGSYIPWSESYFGTIGLQYYIYQELYNVIHIFGTVFVFAFYFLKVKAPGNNVEIQVSIADKKTSVQTASDVLDDGPKKKGPPPAPSNWSQLFKQFLLFPGVIAFLIAWPIYFILDGTGNQIGETGTEILDFLTNGLDFYLLVFVGGSLTIADIVKHSQNLNIWTCYFFRYLIGMIFFLPFLFDIFPGVDMLTKDIMLMFMWLPVPAPFVFYVMMFAPEEDPSEIAAMCALTQISQILIFVFMGATYYSEIQLVE